MKKVLFNENKCIVCEEQKNIGINLNNAFICMECETDIIQTETNNPKYNYYVKKLSKIKQSHQFIK